MSDRKELTKEISRITERVVETAVDLVLLEIFFGMEAIVNPPTPGGAWKAYHKSYRDLDQLDYQTIKRAFYNLKSKGLIQYTRETILTPRITDQGLKRLKATIPFYNKARTWDGKIYLVTYDVPEEQKNDRELLRHYLKKIGCGKLQNSVWITPYNPQGVLEDFVKKTDLAGAVVISAVGDKQNVGKESLEELVARVYDLDELHGRYLDFNLKYHKVTKFKPETKSEVVFDFLSILKDDPQLPFKILPPDWAGTEAYQIFKKATR